MTFGIASKAIGSIFMNDAADDEIGIRGTAGANLAYNTNGASFAWFGSGILNKPISDFGEAVGNRGIFYSKVDNANRPFFMHSGGRIELKHNSRSIPEPEGYMLIAGFAVLLYVVIRNAYDKRNGG